MMVVDFGEEDGNGFERIKVVVGLGGGDSEIGGRRSGGGGRGVREDDGGGF